ncbi:unnamed protein product [Caenorhabditis bovis]|uniref:Uncharacterized protein n=1 Tax=Caenorhabditis bovis TaxID=2654633 RepID=A0A8S1FE19_9PELO|nr:unnamed protein product [Caenorhabditis bovis]
MPLAELEEADNEMSSSAAGAMRTPGGSDRHRRNAPIVRPPPSSREENNNEEMPRKLSQYEIVTEPWKMWRRAHRLRVP